MPSHYIETDAALADFCTSLANADFIAIDTEFVRERTYYPQLALIQIGTPDVIACIDPLKINDMAPLNKIFQTENITKVFHASSQDMEIFYYLFGELPKPVFDSQIAATVLGLGEQVGYAALVKQVLDIDLDKSHSRTDWLQRPLDPKQISYAEDDVRYLSKIYPMLIEQLQTRNRLDWLTDDFSALSDAERYAPAPDNIWRKIKGLNKLKGVQLAILQKLGGWREEQAMQADIPRRRIVSDDILIDMARLRPKNLQALGKLRGISTGLVNKFGETLLSLIQEAEDSPKESWPKLLKPRRLNSGEDAIVDTLSAILKLCAHQHQISPTCIASRKELEQLVRGDKDLSLLQGWRLHHGGQQCLDFFSGQASLHIENSQLSLGQ